MKYIFFFSSSWFKMGFCPLTNMMIIQLLESIQLWRSRANPCPALSTPKWPIFRHHTESRLGRRGSPSWLSPHNLSAHLHSHPNIAEVAKSPQLGSLSQAQIPGRGEPSRAWASGKRPSRCYFFLSFFFFFASINLPFQESSLSSIKVIC